MASFSKSSIFIVVCILVFGGVGCLLFSPTAIEDLNDKSVGDAATVLNPEHPFFACAVCHGAQGEGNEQLMAPQLRGQQPAYLESQIRAFQAGWRGADVQDVQGKLMADALAALSQNQIDAALAYINNLPSVAPVTSGAVAHARGKYLYEKNCSICHGVSGEGSSVESAIPRLDMQHAWYLQRQLQHFRARLRGFHPDDVLGNSMGFYAQLLPDDQAVFDVVSWIKYQASQTSKAASEE